MYSFVGYSCSISRFSILFPLESLEATKINVLQLIITTIWFQTCAGRLAVANYFLFLLNVESLLLSMYML